MSNVIIYHSRFNITAEVIRVSVSGDLMSVRFGAVCVFFLGGGDLVLPDQRKCGVCVKVKGLFCWRYLTIW